MDKFYWNYKTPSDFSDMVMFSDGEYLTGLVFYTPMGCDFNRWSRKKNTAEVFCAGSEKPMGTQSGVSTNVMLETPAATKFKESTKSTEYKEYKESAKPTESKEHKGAKESAEFAKCNESTKATKHMGSDEPTEFAESEKPTESTEPAEFAESEKPTESTKPAECAESKHEGSKCFINGSTVIKKWLPVFEETTRWLDVYFGKDADGKFTLPSRWPDFTPPIKIYGLTPFREKVLNTIRTIPFGETMTYGQIAASIAAESSDAASIAAESLGAASTKWNQPDAASTKTNHQDSVSTKAESSDTANITAERSDAASNKADHQDAASNKASCSDASRTAAARPDAASTSPVKKRMSAQAVGGAVGWNPICLIIPCHRVMGAGGKLTGYGGGIINKIALLDMEGIVL